MNLTNNPNRIAERKLSAILLSTFYFALSTPYPAMNASIRSRPVLMTSMPVANESRT